MRRIVLAVKIKGQGDSTHRYYGTALRILGSLCKEYGLPLLVPSGPGALILISPGVELPSEPHITTSGTNTAVPTRSTFNHILISTLRHVSVNPATLPRVLEAPLEPLNFTFPSDTPNMLGRGKLVASLSA